MNWLTNFVRPRIRALVQKSEVPDNLWHKCPSCEQMLFHRELEADFRVCQHCDHHMRLGADARLKLIFDDNSMTLLPEPKVLADPLRFRDHKRYTDRLKDAQNKTSRRDGLMAGHGTIGGTPAVVAVMDFDFMGGSMGIAVGEGLVAAAREAIARKAAYIVVSASGGARMQEGILSLMQMPRTTVAVEEVREAGLPYIVVLTDPTTGGVSASFAMLGDITLAEPGAVIGFAGRRVIEETIREKLPDDFQTAEYLREHGMVDRVVHRHQLRDTLAGLIDLLMRPQGKNSTPALAAPKRVDTADKGARP